MGFIQELADLEKSLAGFHPTHYIRDKLIAQIAILKPKAEGEKKYLVSCKLGNQYSPSFKLSSVTSCV